MCDLRNLSEIYSAAEDVEAWGGSPIFKTLETYIFIWIVKILIVVLATVHARTLSFQTPINSERTCWAHNKMVLACFLDISPQTTDNRQFKFYHAS